MFEDMEEAHVWNLSHYRDMILKQSFKQKMTLYQSIHILAVSLGIF